MSIESEDDHLELLNYLVIWIRRQEEFLEKKISISEFCSEFCDRGQLISDTVAILESN